MNKESERKKGTEGRTYKSMSKIRSKIQRFYFVEKIEQNLKLRQWQLIEKAEGIYIFHWLDIKLIFDLLDIYGAVRRSEALPFQPLNRVFRNVTITGDHIP